METELEFLNRLWTYRLGEVAKVVSDRIRLVKATQPHGKVKA
jgi:hypothetical protein